MGPWCSVGRALTACLVVAVALPAAVSAAGGGATAMMAVSDLRPGMKGRGLTVLRGIEPEEFDVEILGVLAGAFPRGDVILARLGGAAIERVGVAAGMSGSPVYVEGRLVGAVALTWQMLKEPMCGITPIHQMLGAVQPEPREAAGFARGLDWTEPLPPVARLALRFDDPWLPLKPAEHSPRPIVTPLAVSAYSAGLMDGLAPHLERLGMAAMPGGAAGRSAERVELKPGGALGVQFIGGDLTAIAIGTVTHIGDDLVLAFGHPLMRLGRCDLPISGAEVHAVVPRQTLSMKMASPTAAVGSLTGDYAFGVAGRLGVESPTLPCTVLLRNRTRGRQETYSYRLARHPQVTWFLAGLALGLSVERAEGVMEHTMAVRLQADIEGRQPVVLRDRMFTHSPAMEMFSVGAALRLLWENPWERVEFRGVRVEIDLIEGRRTAQIVGMRLSADSARRGEEVSAFVRLRPHQSPEETEREVRFRVPHLTPVGGRVGVIACDAAASASISRALAPGRYRPRSLAQLIRIVEEFPTGDELVVRMSKPGQGVTLEGAAMPDLPDSARDILTGAARTGYEMMSDDVVQRQSTPWILTGSATLWIKVKGDEEP